MNVAGKILVKAYIKEVGLERIIKCSLSVTGNHVSVFDVAHVDVDY